MVQKNATWLGHKIQNEMISTLAHIVTEDIATEIKEANYFTLIVDETKDVVNRSKYLWSFVILREERCMKDSLVTYELRSLMLMH